MRHKVSSILQASLPLVLGRVAAPRLNQAQVTQQRYAARLHNTIIESIALLGAVMRRLPASGYAISFPSFRFHRPLPVVVQIRPPLFGVCRGIVARIRTYARHT